MKLRVEISPEAEEEAVIIRCRARSEEICQLERILEELIRAGSDMVLSLGDTEYYVPIGELLFFETCGGKVTAHTADRMYYTACRLFELERRLPGNFVRVSKSCILNVAAISALTKNLTGASRVMFRGTEKAVYVSRAYYKLLKDKIEEIRFRPSMSEGIGGT